MLAGQWSGGWFPSLFSQRRGRIGTTGLWAEGLECTIVSRCPSMAPPGGTGATLMASGPTGASWVNSSLGGLDKVWILFQTLFSLFLLLHGDPRVFWFWFWFCFFL